MEEDKMRNRLLSSAAALGAVLALSVTTAGAAIVGQVGGSVTSPAASETFNVNKLTNSVTWTGTDITVVDSGTGADWYWSAGPVASLGCDSSCLYQNGGTAGVATIALNSGAAISAIDVRVGNGFGPANPQFLWVQTFNNGVSTGFEFDFDLATPATFSIISLGTEFDEIRLANYSSATTRNAHSLSNTSAVSISDVQIGSASVPEPASLALVALGLAGLAAARGRKK